MSRSLPFRSILLTLFLLCLARLGYGQGDTARLQGTISDPQNAAVRGASVAVTSADTGRTVSVTGPGSSNIDLALFKNFSVTEHQVKAQFRVQAYNLTNTPHFANPDSDLSHGTFGLINSVQPFSWRQVELGLRVTF